MESKKRKELFEAYKKEHRDANESIREYVVGKSLEYTKDSEVGMLIEEILDIIHDI